MAYIKSYSNYVIQQKHQVLNNGTVFERDFSTVGGIGDTFNSKQKVYRQGTFVYSINGEIITPKLYSKEGWKKNGENDVWTKNDIANNINEQNSLSIVLKQDYYKLKDFAYFGSCTELIRASINDIIQSFPGELFVPKINDSGILVITTDNEPLNNEDEYQFLIDNPFHLDIHTSFNAFNFEESEDLKNIQPNIDKYELFDGTNTYNISQIVITHIEDGGCGPRYFQTVKVLLEGGNIEEGNNEFTIKCYYDENEEIIYLTNAKNLEKHIRPKSQYLNNFYNSLDSFQKLLLNKDSKPKYTTTFEVAEETEDGYRFFYQKFTFPVTYGGHNLDVISSDYFQYISSLSQYSTLFDEMYCNNLYRQMTHEAIKNFDWSDTLNRGEETKEDYVENGDKFQKMLLLFARELDEIKFYIDGIKNTNIITYNDANNLPDYFLTDTLKIEGWDVKNVFPFKITNNQYFEEDLNLTYKPYTTFYNGYKMIDYPHGYFSGYYSDGCKQDKVEANDIYGYDNKGFFRNKIKQYISDKEYTMQELNNKFMKYLKLNSRSIFQKKGTVECIESLLSLFGLRSKRWSDAIEDKTQDRISVNNDNNNAYSYDYEIKEYVAITSALEDKPNDGPTDERELPTADYLIDFLNSTKTLSYNTNEYINQKDVPYIGLPVRYYEKNNGEQTRRFLYPYFSPNINIDGKPYYQMKGGWMHKDYSYTTNEITNSEGGYVDTNSQIPSVDNLQELLKLQNKLLHNNIVYYVKNILGDYVCVDDELYDIHFETINGKTIRYIAIPVNDGSIEIGRQYWYGEIVMFDNTYKLHVVDLTKYKNNSLVKIYVNDENIIHISQDESFLNHYGVFKDGNLLINDDTFDDEFKGPLTNYFILYDVEWKGVLGLFGWNQLQEDSKEYQTIIKFKRNYNANNPHTNGLKYDNGAEYLSYFGNLFKYAVSQEAFNSNCYPSRQSYMSALNYMENEIGFNNLITWDEEKCKETLKLYEDTKIHHFCDYYENGKVSYFTELENVVIQNDEVKVENNVLFLKKNVLDNVIEINGEIKDNTIMIGEEDIYNFYETEDYNYLRQNDLGYNELYVPYIEKTTCLDQIINLKNVDLIFKCFKNDKIKQMKYVDEVILHYLAQVVPPNVILNIKFEG